jgi:prevent-host-death family protein
MYKTRNILYNLAMEQEIPISEVRERLLSLVDDLPRDGVIITRHGNPIARLMPVRTATADLIGSLKGIITDPDDDLFSTGEQWDAQS